MGFIILFFIAILGIGILLIVLDKKTQSTNPADKPDASQKHRWFDPPIAAYVEQGTKKARTQSHAVSRTVLIAIIGWYRTIRSRVHVFSYLKRKIRAYLYEHDRTGGPKHISTFLKHVKTSGPNSPSKPLEKNIENGHTLDS